MENLRIIYKNSKGDVAILIPCDCGLTIEEIAAKDVPTGSPYRIVDSTEIPSDRTFRNAWEIGSAELTDGIRVNLQKAIEIAHAARRVSRAIAFAPLDIKSTIPHMADQAEADRKVIRSDDDDLQISMDAAKDEVELKALMTTGS